MRLTVISDIHVEFYKDPRSLQRKLDDLFTDICKEDILLLVGDVGVAGDCKLMMDSNYKAILEFIAKRWNYVIMIPGNHEYYDRNRSCSLDDIDEMIRTECNKLGILFLNKNVAVLERKGETPIAFIGCTLWSDATKKAYSMMNDKLKAILNHDELIQIHSEHRDWLDRKLEEYSKQNYKIVVLTHHLPLVELTHPKYLEEKYQQVNSGYCSDLSDIIKKYSESIDLWCCGHTHEFTETKKYGVRFYINPMGYPRESRETEIGTKTLRI